jgi:hypothetical protein
MICLKCRQSLNEKDVWYGLHKKCFKQWFDLNQLEEFLDVAVRSQSQILPGVQGKNSSFFHGKFRKYSSRLGKSSYILKVEQPEYPELPVTEFLCNQIYESLGVAVPDYYLVRFPQQQYCFVTKNFMSGLIGESLVHTYHFIQEGMRYDCESIVNIIGEKTGRRADQEDFVYLTLADSLIGNNDRHGRNLGFIRSPKGISLAPFYDNPSALAVEDASFLQADLQPRGCIFTFKSDKPTMQDYVEEWNRLGYEAAVDCFRENLSLKKLEKMVHASYLSEKRQKAFLNLMTKRMKEICTT